jgi:hypothetical protein
MMNLTDSKNNNDITNNWYLPVNNTDNIVPQKHKLTNVKIKTSNNVNSSNENAIKFSKDAQTIFSVLTDMGIHEFDPKVVNQLLEISYR